MKNKILSIICSLLIVGSLQGQSIVDIVVGSADHNTLETAVIAADLAGALSAPGPFTLFAPTDAAFSAIDSDVLSSLLEDPTGELARILTFHVVSGVADGDNIFDGLSIGTLEGGNLTFSSTGGDLFINGAKVTVANIEADNGVVHVIDAVLLPGSSTPATVVDVVVNSPDHTQLESLVIAANLAGTLSGDGPFTVFAPTDDAFAALPESLVNSLVADPTGVLANVLLYHVMGGVADSGNLSDGLELSTLLGENVDFTINGDGVFINGAQVTVADIRTGNGVVHVINSVIVPPGSMTVFDIIGNSADHTTLASLVTLAELDGALSGDGPFTVFAPTDAAFAALPEDLVNSLVADPTGALANILLYHVTSGVADSSNISDGLRISTLQGDNLEFSASADGVRVNGVNISVVDIRGSNGTVHVIDAVLTP